MERRTVRSIGLVSTKGPKVPRDIVPVLQYEVNEISRTKQLRNNNKRSTVRQMSIASYRRNVARRVTGPFIPTCFPAALEQISPYHSLPPGVYREYKDFVNWYGQLRREARETNNDELEYVIDRIVGSLGGLTCRDVLFKRAETPLGFKRIVNQLIAQDYRVAVDVSTGRGAHTVGLLPLPEEGLYTLVSTQLPQTLQGVVTLDHISQRLFHHQDRHMSRYPFSDANITALPAA